MTALYKWLALAFALLLAAIVVAADRGVLPGVVQQLYAFPGGDKVGHFLLMGGFALVATLALPRPVARAGLAASVPLGALVVLVLVTLEEASQARFPGRTLSALDLAASYAGIAAGAWAARRMRGPAAVAAAPRAAA